MSLKSLLQLIFFRFLLYREVLKSWSYQTHGWEYIGKASLSSSGVPYMENEKSKTNRLLYRMEIDWTNVILNQLVS